MLQILQIVLPVFIVIGVGYLAAYLKLFTSEQSSALMRFATQIAIPCLLFLAISRLDLQAEFQLDVLAPFFIGALASFTVTSIGAWFLFGHKPGYRIAIGFAGMFSNLVLIGLSIVELAFGSDALKPAFAIVALHAPFCYVIGITAMEISRADGVGVVATAQAVVKQVFSNAITVGLLLGIVANLLGITPPAAVNMALELIARSALPVALFALGAVLVKYKISSNLGEVSMISFNMLVLHPVIAYVLGHYVFNLTDEVLNVVVLMAAMPPGMNAYAFADLYNRAKGIAASSVLFSTALSVLSISVWLVILR
ncbi:MAG: AEC family transporter [Leucothrix sp.]